MCDTAHALNEPKENPKYVQSMILLFLLLLICNRCVDRDERLSPTFGDEGR